MLLPLVLSLEQEGRYQHAAHTPNVTYQPATLNGVLIGTPEGQFTRDSDTAPPEFKTTLTKASFINPPTNPNHGDKTDLAFAFRSHFERPSFMVFSVLVHALADGRHKENNGSEKSSDFYSDFTHTYINDTSIISLNHPTN